jgi:hypothetical protein
MPITVTWRKWTKQKPTQVEHELSFEGVGDKSIFKIKMDPNLKPDEKAKYF